MDGKRCPDVKQPKPVPWDWEPEGTAVSPALLLLCESRLPPLVLHRIAQGTSSAEHFTVTDPL